MAGGAAVPFRIWRIPRVPPLDSPGPSLPKSFEVDLESCTSFAGFSFRSDGWNPHVETVKALMDDPGLEFAESPLATLYERFRPTTLQELFVEDADAPLEPLSFIPTTRAGFRYVWALSPSRLRQISQQATPEGHHYFGPQSSEGAVRQFERLRDLVVSISERGFRPEGYGPIGGYFLVAGDQYRFVVGTGNHRLAVIRVLGPDRFPASLLDSHPAVIDRARIESWSTDHGGPFAPGAPEVLFDKLMFETGLGKARFLGLVS